MSEKRSAMAFIPPKTLAQRWDEETSIEFQANQLRPGLPAAEAFWKMAVAVRQLNEAIRNIPSRSKEKGF